MLCGLGSKWLQKALRSLCKCAILLFYSTSPLRSWGLTLFIGTSDDPSYKWAIWPLQIEVSYSSTYWVAGRWAAGSLHSTELFCLDLEPLQGVRGTGPALLHRLVGLVQISTRACGSVALCWSVLHFKLSTRGSFINCDDFIIATQCCLLRRTQWISLTAVSFPLFPPPPQKVQIHLKSRDLSTCNGNFHPHKRIRNSLA